MTLFEKRKQIYAVAKSNGISLSDDFLDPSPEGESGSRKELAEKICACMINILRGEFIKKSGIFNSCKGDMKRLAELYVELCSLSAGDYNKIFVQVNRINLSHQKYWENKGISAIEITCSFLDETAGLVEGMSRGGAEKIRSISVGIRECAIDGFSHNANQYAQMVVNGVQQYIKALTHRLESDSHLNKASEAASDWITKCTKIPTKADIATKENMVVAEVPENLRGLSLVRPTVEKCNSFFSWLDTVPPQLRGSELYIQLKKLRSYYETLRVNDPATMVVIFSDFDFKGTMSAVLMGGYDMLANKAVGNAISTADICVGRGIVESEAGAENTYGGTSSQSRVSFTDRINPTAQSPNAMSTREALRRRMGK